MKTLKFKDKAEWLEARVGKITGTRAKDIISKRTGSSPKKGYYELIAERVAIPHNGEDYRERGLRLEQEALDLFEKQTGEKVDRSLVMWVSEKNESLAISPDGFMGKTKAIENKCLSSPFHIEVYLTQELPSEFYYQALQYFIINKSLKTLYFSFYNPDIPAKSFFYLTIERAGLEEEIEKTETELLRVLDEIEKITLDLSQF